MASHLPHPTNELGLLAERRTQCGGTNHPQHRKNAPTPSGLKSPGPSLLLATKKTEPGSGSGAGVLEVTLLWGWETQPPAELPRLPRGGAVPCPVPVTHRSPCGLLGTGPVSVSTLGSGVRAGSPLSPDRDGVRHLLPLEMPASSGPGACGAGAVPHQWSPWHASSGTHPPCA